MVNHLLFHHYNIFDVINSRKLELQEEIKHMPAMSLQGDVHAIAKELTRKYLLAVPVLQEDKQYMTREETEIDISGDPMSRFMYGSFDGEPIYVGATEVTVCIPFDGEPVLFNVQPQSFSLNPFRGDVSGNELKLTFVVRQGGEDLKKQYDHRMSNVREHLRWLSESVAHLPEKLVEEAVPAILRRKMDLEARAAAVSSLGIPVKQQRQEIVSPPALRATAALPQAQPSSKTWDVFISHAGEDKDEIARPLAQALQVVRLAVWFDEHSLQLVQSTRQN